MYDRISSVDKSSPDNDDPFPWSELDSHANMVVLGKHTYVFDGIPSRTCDVLPFDPRFGPSRKKQIIDGALAYDCPFTLKTFILEFRNSLYMKKMDHNLIPPFILREVGLEINETTKIHCRTSTTRDHVIISQDHGLLIPIVLNGIFFFFHTRKPNNDDLENGTIIPFTPEGAEWNPYTHNYEIQEENMTDWNGDINIRQTKRICPEPTKYDWDIYEKEIDRVKLPSVVGYDPNEDVLYTSMSGAEHEN